MKNLKLANRFLKKAAQDFIVIKKFCADSDIADEIIGFHAQQAAEKMLKAVLVYHGIEIPFTHRLTDLIDLGKENNIILPNELENIRFLTPFAVEFRYDFYVDDESTIDFKKTLLLLEKLRDWTNSIIPQE